MRYPLSEAPLPANLSKLQTTFNRAGRPGHFAFVAVANTEDPFDPMAATNGNYPPLYRGHGMHAREIHWFGTDRVTARIVPCLLGYMLG